MTLPGNPSGNTPAQPAPRWLIALAIIAVLLGAASLAGFIVTYQADDPPQTQSLMSVSDFPEAKVIETFCAAAYDDWLDTYVLATDVSLLDYPDDPYRVDKEVRQDTDAMPGDTVLLTLEDYASRTVTHIEVVETPMGPGDCSAVMPFTMPEEQFMPPAPEDTFPTEPVPAPYPTMPYEPPFPTDPYTNNGGPFTLEVVVCGTFDMVGPMTEIYAGKGPIYVEDDQASGFLPGDLVRFTTYFDGSVEASLVTTGPGFAATC